MSMYMGRNETSHAVTEALEVLRKYPHQWITYNPNDPLANSVVTYLKMKGKVTTNRFHQFQAVPKHRTNPAPGYKSRAAKLVAMGAKIDAEKKRTWASIGPKAKRLTSAMYYSKKWSPWRKLNEKTVRISDMLMREAAKENARRKKNPGPKANRYARLAKVADAADAAFMRAVKKQFPRERAGDARYQSNRFNAATKKAAARMRKASDALSAFIRGK